MGKNSFVFLPTGRLLSSLAICKCTGKLKRRRGGGIGHNVKICASFSAKISLHMNFGYGSVCMKSMVAQTTHSRKTFIMQANGNWAFWLCYNMGMQQSGKLRALKQPSKPKKNTLPHSQRTQALA